MENSDSEDEAIPTPEKAPVAKATKGTKKRPARGKKTAKKKPAKTKQQLLLEELIEEKIPQDFGHYQLGDKLGRGAFGSVYKGLDTETGQMVAIKTIALKKSADAIDGVQQEIELMKMLDNEHIVRYIDSHSTDDFLYIVMEYLPQGSLQQIQKKFGKNMKENLIAHYIEQVLVGLKYLHSQSIIHRDIKAANILLSNNDAKLSDFGISIKLDENAKNDGDFNFSAYWTAPEVISMDPITEKCDIWSVGITAIELFSGEPPYYELAAVPAAFKIIQNESPPLPEDISKEFRDFLKCCLTKNVAFRKSATYLLEHSEFLKKYRKNPLGESKGDDDSESDDYLFETMRGGPTARFDTSRVSQFSTDSLLVANEPAARKMSLEAWEEKDSDMDFECDDTAPSKPLVQLPGLKGSTAPTGLDAFVEDDDSDSFFSDLNPAPAANAPKPALAILGDDDSDDFNDLQPMVQNTTPRKNGLDAFVDDDDSGSFFNDKPEIVPQPQAQMAILGDDDSDDDFNDLQPMAASTAPRKGLDAFVEDDDSDSLFKDTLDGDDIVMTTTSPGRKLADFINEDDSDDMDFEGEFSAHRLVVPVAAGAPQSYDDMAMRLDELDDMGDEDNEFERQKEIMTSFREDMDRICTGNLGIDKINDICGNLYIQLTKKNPWIKDRLPRDCIAPIVQIIQSRNPTILEATFPLILMANEEHPKLHKGLCIMGVLPYLFEYVTSKEYSESIQVKALNLLHMFCTTKPDKKKKKKPLEKRKPLQMFIAAGGLPKLCEIFAIFPHDERPILTPMVMEIVTAVFTFNSGTPKSSFARILSHTAFLVLLSERYLEIRDTDQSMKQICNIFEIFSSSDHKAKGHMAAPFFIQTLFERAAFKADRSTTDPYHDLTDWDLFTIMRCMNNIAMDKEIVKLLWETELPEQLLKYLDVNVENFQMTPTRNTAFSAIFHLIRSIRSDNFSRIKSIIPTLIYIIDSRSTLKELAISLFLDLISNGATCRELVVALKKYNAIDALFKLLATTPHKEQIIHAFEAWSLVDHAFIDKHLSERHAEFVPHLVHIFNSGSMSVQSEVATRLSMLCNLCPNTTSILAGSKLVKVMVRKLMGGSLAQYESLRRDFATSILEFYRASFAPKRMVAQFRIDRVGKKLRKDPSKDIRSIATRLLQAIASNYVL